MTVSEEWVVPTQVKDDGHTRQYEPRVVAVVRHYDLPRRRRRLRPDRAEAGVRASLGGLVFALIVSVLALLIATALSVAMELAAR
jgi:hypothetical protein